ncbi:MAG: putative Zn-dependent peptidase, partial [Myxococcota bacterium]
YFAGGYVVGFRHDGKHHVPTIEKPRLDPVPIDPKRQSTFVKTIAEENVPSLTPRWVVPERDFETAKTGGVTVYAAKNRLNELFKLSIVIPIGLRHDKRLQLAERLLGKSGAGERSAEETAQAWYRLGTDFRIEVGDNETRFVIEGLDHRLEESLALAEELIRSPNASDDTLAGLVKILRSQRTDSRKDQKVVESALQLFSRYGNKSAYLARLPMSEVEKLTTSELTGVMRSILTTRHRVSYTGPRPLAGVVSLLDKHHRPGDATAVPPAPVRLKMATPMATEIRFIHLPMAQALVRIEQVDGIYNPELFPEVELYNNYFAGGMNGIVFQELRESRALAYTAQARYMTGGRKGDENVMLGRIGTQADKTVDAVKAFLDLLDNMPQSESRFGPAKQGVITAYQTTRVGFRRVLDRVQSWEKLGVSIDPREQWYTKGQTLGLANIVAFHKSHLANKPKLISIVGDQSKIDLDKLKEIGPVTILTADDIIRL